jgi:hypothetical protein
MSEKSGESTKSNRREKKRLRKIKPEIVVKGTDKDFNYKSFYNVQRKLRIDIYKTYKDEEEER